MSILILYMPNHTYSCCITNPLSLPSDARLDAVELLLHSFGSAATYLNPQATRCTCLYTLGFDPSGTVVSASVKVATPVHVSVYTHTA